MSSVKNVFTSAVVSSFLWKFMERASTQIINLVVQISLARMIAPEDFGSLAVLIVFYNLSNIFIQKGLSSSLIRKKETDELDYNTAFLASLFVATCLVIILFFIAPYIAEIYKSEELVSALRILSISLLFGSLYCIQNAILVRTMQFKIIFIRGLKASIFSGVIGISMALCGYGLWALVAQILTNQIVLCISVRKSIEWKPKFQFSINRLNDILSFGGKILISELIVYTIESVRTLLIGKKYSVEDLAFYDRGQMYPATIMRSIYDTIGSVLLPVYSRHQDEEELLISAMYQTIFIAMFLITPIFVGMAAVAEPLISILLTDKWLPCVPYFIIFCFYQIPYPIQGITRQLLYAKGQSALVLKMEVVKGIVTITTLIISYSYGVLEIAVAALVTTYCVTIINLIYTRRVIPIQIKTILHGMTRTILYNVIMFLIVYSINYLALSNTIKIMIQISLGISSYFVLAKIFRDQNYLICISLLNKIFIRNSSNHKS